MSEKKELEVSAIKNGTVIDHIPANVTFKIVQILDLYNHPGAITIGTNLDSITLGRKGIIKIADRYLSDEEIGRLSVVSPDVTLNIIKDYQIVEKKYVKYPKQISQIISPCPPRWKSLT